MKGNYPPPARAEPHVALARGTLLSLVALLVSNLRSLFTLLVAWRLGKAGLGVYALAWSVTDIVSRIGTFGLDQTTTTWVARHPGSDRAVLRYALRWGLPLSTACAGLATLATLAYRHWLPTSGALAGPLMLMLWALPAMALYRIASGASRGRMQMHHDIFSRGLTESLVTIGAFLIALRAGAGGHAPSWAVVLGSTASGLVAYALARRFQGGEPDQGITRGLLRFSMPLAGTGLVNLLILRLDVLLLGAFVGRAISIEDFGVYCAAVQFGHLVRNLRLVFEPPLTSVAAEHGWRGNAQAVYDAAAWASRWLLSIGLPVVVVYLFAGGFLMSIYGDGFRTGAAWMLVLGLAQVTNAFAGLAETLVLTTAPRVGLQQSLVVGLGQLAIGLLLIPRFGAMGAAVSMLLSYAAQGALRYGQIRRQYGWTWPWPSILRPLAAFAAAGVLGGLVRLSLSGLAGEIAAAVVALAAFALVLWWQGVEESDRAVLAALLARKAA